jgi:hypothetical protein
VFNLVYAHLLNRTEHSADCKERPGLGLVCANDCTTQRFLDQLDAPLMAWEVAEDNRLRERHEALMRGEIPA